MTTADVGEDAERSATMERIIAHFRTGLAELRCVGSERLVRRGVSIGHLHLMSMLDRHGEMAMSRLAEVLDVSLSNATGLIDRLAERGLVERVRVEDDRRVVLVRLTALGREVLEEVEVLRNDVMRKVLGRLSTAELVRLARSIDALRRAIDEVRAADPSLIAHDHSHPTPSHPLDRTASVATAAIHERN